MRFFHPLADANIEAQTQQDIGFLHAVVAWQVLDSQVNSVLIACPGIQLSKVDKCQSVIFEPKRVKLSAKSQHTSLNEPTEEIQEEFFEKLSHSKYKLAILSIHEKYNRPYLPLSQ